MTVNYCVYYNRRNKKLPWYVVGMYAGNEILVAKFADSDTANDYCDECNKEGHLSAEKTFKPKDRSVDEI